MAAKKTKKRPVKKAKRRAKKKAEPRKKKVDSGLAFNKALSQKGLVELMLYSDDDCLAHLKGKLITGSVALDELLEGGLPFGRIVEVYGQWHIGKSTLLDMLFASAQRVGGWGLVADTEHAKAVEYSRTLGVDPRKLSYLQFDRGKMTLEGVLAKILESVTWWRKNDPDRPVVIGLDSLGGTRVAGEKMDTIGQAKAATADDDKKSKRQPGAAARVMHLFRRDISQELAHTKIVLVVVNHEYQTWGSGKTKRETYGGEALRAASSVRLKLYSVGNWIKRGDGVVVGREVRAELVKDRIHGNTGQVARLGMLYGVGVDNVWSMFEGLKERGIIVRNGNWSAIHLDGEQINFQGFAGLQRLCAAEPKEGQAPLFDRLLSVYQQVRQGGN